MDTNLTKWLSKCEGSLLEGKEKNTNKVIMMMKVTCGNKKNIRWRMTSENQNKDKHNNIKGKGNDGLKRR